MVSVREASAKGKSRDAGEFPAGRSHAAVAEVKWACPGQRQPQGSSSIWNHGKEIHTLLWKSFLPSGCSVFAQSCMWVTCPSTSLCYRSCCSLRMLKKSPSPNQGPCSSMAARMGNTWWSPRALLVPWGQVLLQDRIYGFVWLCYLQRNGRQAISLSLPQSISFSILFSPPSFWATEREAGWAAGQGQPTTYY